MKSIFISLSVLSSFLCNAQSITRLLAASPFDDNLVVFDTSTYATVATRTLTFSGGTFQGLNGLARRSSTGIYYAVVNNGSGNRYLATLNPNTASLTSIGLLGDNFSQITFNGNNTLLGVTGQGASTPCAVFRINTANANKSFLANVSSGFGQLICYNPTDNKIYHWYSGNPQMDSYDTSFVTTTTLNAYSGGNETIGAVYKTGNTFVTHDFNADFRNTRSNATSSIVTTYNSHYFKGLTYITCSRTITPSSQVVCGSTSSITLNMSGTTGATYQWFKNGLAINGATLSALSTSATGTGYYKCRIDDGCGMDTLAPGVSLTLAPLPIVSISGPTLACSSSSVLLTGSSGGSSQWYRNGLLISGANSNTYSPTSAGKYNMIKTNTNGCKDSAAVGLTLVLAASPTITATSGSICAGNSFTISASGAITYTYSGGNIVSPVNTSTYTVVGSGTNGCSSSPAVITVTVSPAPTLSISTTKTVICLNEMVSLTGMGATTFTWNNAVLNGVPFSPTVTNTYSLSGTDANGCVGTAAITVSVNNCVGIINSHANNSGVSIFPNPNNGSAIIHSEQNFSFELINEIGQSVLSAHLSDENNHTLVCNNLAQGVYYLIGKTEQKTIVQKIVVLK